MNKKQFKYDGYIYSALVLVVIIFWLCLCVSFTTPPNYKEYNSKDKLVVSDFIMIDTIMNGDIARSYTGISVTWDRFENRFIATAFFDRSQSHWYKGITDTAYVLEHEQGHFDITASFAWMLNQRYMYDNLTIEDQRDLYYRYMKQRSKIQAMYDEETNHSKNRQKQKEWNETISRMNKSDY